MNLKAVYACTENEETDSQRTCLHDPGVSVASVHGLTPLTVHMNFSLSRDNFERRGYPLR